MEREMEKKIEPKEVADKFAVALELLLKWIDQNRKIQIPKSAKERPLSDLTESSLLNASETSKLLGISESYVYRLMQQNKLPTIRLGGSVRIKMGDLDKLLETLKSQPKEK